MFGRVPLARRNVLAEPRRLVASAAGVGTAIMLILLLDGLWAGIKANITTYEDHVGADLYVAQPVPATSSGSSASFPPAPSTPSVPTPMSTGRSRCADSSRSWTCTTARCPPT
jgi:putative ABC transport system permease protein